MSKPETKWLIAARRLDEAALEAIYDAFSDELYRYAYRLIGEQQAAEDLVAETFFRFLRTLHAGGGPREHLRAYLYRVAHNLAVDGHRRGYGEVQELPEDGETLQSEDDPSAEAETVIQGEKARAALWRLTSDQRQVIVLKFFQGLSNKEISAAIEKPVGAVKALQHRGLNTMRRILEIDRSDTEGKA
jgi:RNA polymerase sigma-70 factor (ECF subfamily)